MKKPSALNVRAALFGLIVFSVPYLAIVLLGDAYKVGRPVGSLFVYQFLLLIVAGFVTGRLTGEGGLLHGAIVGGVAPFIIGFGYFANMIDPDAAMDSLMANAPLWLLQSEAGCLVGAFAATLVARK